MYDPPAYLWVITIAGVSAVLAETCILLRGGAVRAGLGRRRAALLAGGAVAVLGGWLTASAVIAGHGWYHTRLGHGVPWMPVAVAGFLGVLLALSLNPAAARALAAPGMDSRLLLPHSFRVAGVTFLLVMATGHLPALFALPAGLGDMAVGIATPFVARRLSRGTGRRAVAWLSGLGLTDLVVALALGAIVGYQLVYIRPSGAPISGLPLVLIPTVEVPLLITLHITSLLALRRTRQAASLAGAITPAGSPRPAAARS